MRLAKCVDFNTLKLINIHFMCVSITKLGLLTSKHIYVCEFSASNDSLWLFLLFYTHSTGYELHWSAIEINKFGDLFKILMTKSCDYSDLNVKRFRSTLFCSAKKSKRQPRISLNSNLWSIHHVNRDGDDQPYFILNLKYKCFFFIDTE